MVRTHKAKDTKTAAAVIVSISTKLHKMLKTVIDVDIAKNSVHVMTVDQKSGKKKNVKVPLAKFVQSILNQEKD